MIGEGGYDGGGVDHPPIRQNGGARGEWKFLTGNGSRPAGRNCQVRAITDDPASPAMKLFSCHTPQHEVLFREHFLPSVPRGFTVVPHELDIEGNGDFMTPGFIRCVHQKVELVLESIRSNPGDVFVWTDVDIRLIRVTPQDLELHLGGHDIAFQSERRKGDEFNAGFIDFDAESRTSTRGRVGVRAGWAGLYAPFVDAKLFHEFSGDGDIEVRNGTLVDTNYQHALAWYRAFRSLGETFPIWRIHRLIGMGGDKLLPETMGGGVAGVDGNACAIAVLERVG